MLVNMGSQKFPPRCRLGQLAHCVRAAERSAHAPAGDPSATYGGNRPVHNRGSVRTETSSSIYATGANDRTCVPDESRGHEKDCASERCVLHRLPPRLLEQALGVSRAVPPCRVDEPCRRPLGVEPATSHRSILSTDVGVHPIWTYSSPCSLDVPLYLSIVDECRRKSSLRDGAERHLASAMRMASAAETTIGGPRPFSSSKIDRQGPYAGRRLSCEAVRRRLLHRTRGASRHFRREE